MSKITERIEKYLDQYTNKPRMVGDVIHGAHFKGDTGADIRLTDLRGLLAENKQLTADLKTVSITLLDAHKNCCKYFSGKCDCLIDNKYQDGFAAGQTAEREAITTLAWREAMTTLPWGNPTTAALVAAIAARGKYDHRNEPTEIISGILAENNQLTADLKTVSITLLDAHTEKCTFPEISGRCSLDEGGQCIFYHGTDHEKCQYYRICDCPSCQIAAVAAA